MSQVQQMYREQSRSRGAQYEGLEPKLQRYEAALLSELFRRNGREDVVQTATPPGYGYELDDGHTPVDAAGPIVQIAAHPGDGPDFFYATALHMAKHTRYSYDYHEILLTDGERGVDGWHPERTRQVRLKETHSGAEMVGSKLHFMGYPDGGLLSLAADKRARLVRELATLLKTLQPTLLVVHPPKNDHPDHAASFLLTLSALQHTARAGCRAPTLLVHDVEFGLQQHSLWDQHVIDPHPHTHLYPLHSPGLLVDISATHQTAQRALHQHQTQMYDPASGQPKIYADLIDTLAQVRGLQYMPESTTPTPRGQGFSHVVIPGVTSEHNVLPLRLPRGSIYRRVKKRI